MQQIADWLASGAGQRQRPAKVPDEELVAIGGVVLRRPTQFDFSAVLSSFWNELLVPSLSCLKYHP